MTSVPMNPLKSALKADVANVGNVANLTVGINRHTVAGFTRPAKSRARPPSS